MNLVRSTRPTALGPRCRLGFAHPRLLAAAVLVLVLAGVAWALLPKLSDWSSPEVRLLMHSVERGQFVHEINERGNIESASNVEIRCEVKSRGSSGTTILKIVPEGTYVQAGDVLVELDASALEEEKVQYQIVCSGSLAAKVKAEADLKTAKIAKGEYLEGQFKLDQQKIETEILLAQEGERTATQYLEYSKELVRKGYVSKIQLEADEFAVKKAQTELVSAKTKLDVLNQYTKEKEVTRLDSDILTSKARLEAAKHTYELDQGKLDEITEQIAKCTIRAPEPGQVVYANETDRRGNNEVIIEEGSSIRERQVIIRLPDPKRMQVDAKVNEAKIALVDVGMKAAIRLDAFPEIDLNGTVEKVGEYPAPTSWHRSNIKEYETIISIDSSSISPEMSEHLRPGLTAEVDIQVQQLDDVLQVPVQAVFEHGGRHYCILRNGQRWQEREVKIGSSNDAFVTIRGGLEEGELVVIGASTHRDKIELPELPAEAEAPTVLAQHSPAAASKASPKASPKTADRPAGARRGGPPQFSKMDKNGDNLLKKDELPGGMRPLLASVDTNKDGAIDRAEFKAAMSSAARRGSGRGPKPGAGP